MSVVSGLGPPLVIRLKHASIGTNSSHTPLKAVRPTNSFSLFFILDSVTTAAFSSSTSSATHPPPTEPIYTPPPARSIDSAPECSQPTTGSRNVAGSFPHHLRSLHGQSFNWESIYFLSSSTTYIPSLLSHTPDIVDHYRLSATSVYVHVDYRMPLSIASPSYYTGAFDTLGQ